MPLAEDGYGLLPVVEVSPEALAGFDRGKPHLNEFLVNAPNFHRDCLGLTSVVFHRDMAYGRARDRLLHAGQRLVATYHLGAR